MKEIELKRLIQLEASGKGMRLWRNNVGADFTDDGRFVRYGLANESKAMNQKIKSADLIGIKPVIITPDMIGMKLGIFLSREIKRPKLHVVHAGQLAWMDLINSLGGDAAIIDKEGTL